jgi:LysR family transcriptional activator of nhaA
MKQNSPERSVERKISNVNWNQVYYFSLIAAHGSIKNASEVLKLSSSTLSEHISLLESTLDVQLFIRKGPKLILTEAGRKLSWHAKQMFESGQRMLDVASPLRLGCYPVSIGVVPGPHLPMAHRTICEFVGNFGPLEIKISQWNFEELETNLVKKLDFGFADHPSKRRDIVSECLASSEIRFFVSDQWTGHSLREILKKIPLLICQSEASTDAFLEKALDDVDIHPCSVIRAEYPSILLDLCRSGLGVGAFCEGTMDLEERDTMRSLQRPKDTPKIESHTYLLWARDGENTEAISHIRQLIKI